MKVINPSYNLFRRERRLGIKRLIYSLWRDFTVLKGLDVFFKSQRVKAEEKLLAELKLAEQQKLQTQQELRAIILDRLKEYLPDEPYCQEGIWSWSSNQRVDLIFPELMFQNRQTGSRVLFGVAFQVVNPESPKEIEEYRTLFQTGNIPCLLLPLNNVPSSSDFRLGVEKLFNNEFKLLSMK